VRPDGSVRDLQSNDVRAEALGAWHSPHTGALYPSGWRLTLHDQKQLIVRPLVLDQELYFPGVGGLAYWEGAVSIEGDRAGRGYVELTGYGPAAG
jgi:predicted secreted hydrolase